MQGLLSTGELAKLLRVAPNRLSNLIFTGRVNPPKILGRYGWGRADASEAARILGIEDPAVLNHVRNLPDAPKITLLPGHVREALRT